MNITVNGEQRDFGEPLSIMELLSELKLEPLKIAIERNLEIVPKSAYDTICLSEGDKIEIVQFVGGG